jgi:hypothetical protein
MKKTKMSTRRSHGGGRREVNRVLEMEMVREQAERLEQQRIDFEHRAHLARKNLYGLPQTDVGRGWIDSRRRW